MSLPFEFSESADGTLRVDGIVQRAFHSRGAKDELYNQEDLQGLSQMILDNPILGEHGLDSVCNEHPLGRVTASKIAGNDLHITSIVPPPPQTPPELYNYVRDKLRTGNWKAYSLKWIARNDLFTGRPLPNKRIPLEVSFCEEPRFGYAKFTSVSASAKHPSVNFGAVLTPGNPSPTHRNPQMEKSLILQILKEANPQAEVTEDALKDVPESDYGKMLFGTAKKALEERNQFKEQLEKANAVAFHKSIDKAKRLLPQLKRLAPEADVEAWEKLVTDEFPKHPQWDLLHRVFKRTAGELAELDSARAISGTAAPEYTALAASAPKRNKAAPDLEPEKPAAKPEDPKDSVDEVIDRLWNRGNF